MRRLCTLPPSFLRPLVSPAARRLDTSVTLFHETNSATAPCAVGSAPIRAILRAARAVRILELGPGAEPSALWRIQELRAALQGGGRSRANARRVVGSRRRID